MIPRTANTHSPVSKYRASFRRRGASLAALIALACSVGCGPRGPVIERVGVSVSAATSPLPDIPANRPNVSLVEGGEYIYPTIPPFRTSGDGRIAVDLKKRDPRLYLFDPESLSEPFSTAPGDTYLSADRVTLPRSAFYDPSAYPAISFSDVDPEHRTICDPMPDEVNDAFDLRNPHLCAADPDKDCYDLRMITAVSFEHEGRRKAQLWATPFTVPVSNPKRGGSASIHLGDIEVGTPVPGPVFFADGILEPMITSDGHLLVARLKVTNHDPNTGEPRPGDFADDPIDIAYSVAPESADPCDVTAWTEWHPISHAYHDGEMNGRYGIAAYPLRDSHGVLIPDGADLGASYPWIDRKGSNLFFTAVDATLYVQNAADGAIVPRYETACALGDPCLVPAAIEEIGTLENLKQFRGHGFVGSWTHGKMVLLDNAFNNLDYGLPREESGHRLLRLYEDGTAPSLLVDPSGWVRIGTGRGNGGSNLPDLTTENTTFLDSLENLFNYREQLLPLTPRDVVWTVNTGKASAEVAFDDYLDRRALIVAEMGASIQHQGIGGRRLAYHDGFVEETPTSQVIVARGSEHIKIQNAATSPDLSLPAFGTVSGNVRVEPVASGGIVGKGLWLDGQGDSLSFEVPAQGFSVEDSSWYVSLFVDARFDDELPRQLLRFPDDTRVVLVGRDTLEYHAGGVLVATVALDGMALSTEGWTHLSWVVKGNVTRLFVNGYLFDVHLGDRLFRPIEGSLSVGEATGDGQGFRGWIDDFKVLAHVPNFEVICNHARGTLMELDPDYVGDWRAVAAAFSGAAHRLVARALGAGVADADREFVCYHDYRDLLAANTRSLPAETTSVRPDFLFPEGPLMFDTPRPDSSSNSFCTSCHSSGSAISALRLSALDPHPDGYAMQNDSRRQPMQPPPALFGNVPQDSFGPGLPDHDLHVIDHAIDRYLYPNDEP